ncbi:malto-oligosyltrehalose trehalohydrolase [Fodinicurvata sp. EGI_FJ10296]|uniref:malto-oligosyltrehalose trehalohydrolase n=1 Tax=Fodinicurvata sp. EGI_FJ10296 TaxID=3231908 RepID=UPI003452A417
MTAHPLPTYDFGPLVLEKGVRFRIWAPAQAAVGVVLHPETPGEAIHPMRSLADGWFEATIEDAGPGTRYLFDIGDMRVPDPASRYQGDDVMGPSEVPNPRGYAWRNNGAPGRPFHEAVIYELHVGAFSPEGTFDGVRQRLGHLAELGVTAIELMPVSDFSGDRGWGYDGVLPFAIESRYGRPEDLKRLVDEIHGYGMLAYIDVVYNHFGPEGNFLHQYAPDFFTDAIETPWGAAIDFNRPQVRRFFIENALYYLGEFRFDGLRMDAVQEIPDSREPHFLTELAGVVRATLGGDRHIHLILENDDNAARYLQRCPQGGPARHDAQWNDDYHHVVHHIATGEGGGYYGDYTDAPLRLLAASLAEGFVYQGQPSAHRDGRQRGESSGHLPPSAFVNFIQNHDQIGNRALGERLSTLIDDAAHRAVRDLLLLAPNPPLLFMGDEWASRRPFLFFCDFHDELADAVREGRRREFARFPEFADASKREAIPDPNAAETFAASCLDWSEADAHAHRAWQAEYKGLLSLRHSRIMPLIAGLRAREHGVVGEHGIRVTWSNDDGARLTVIANLGPDRLNIPMEVSGSLLHSTNPLDDALSSLPAWTTTWWIDDGNPGSGA